MSKLHILPEPVQEHVHGDIADVLAAIKALPAEEQPALIVIDTRARCTVGLNENDATDQGAAIAGIDELRTKTGAAVIEIHHSPRGEERERGSNATRAATDTLIYCAADGDLLTVTVKRQKDMDEGEPITMRKRIVELPNGRTSLVLEHVSANELKRQPRSLTELPASHRKVLEALRGGGIRGNNQLAAAAEISERHIYRVMNELKAKKLMADKGFKLTEAGLALLDGIPEGFDA